MTKPTLGVSRLTKNIQDLKLLIVTNSSTYEEANEQFDTLITELNNSLDTTNKLTSRLTESEFYRYNTFSSKPPKTCSETNDRGLWYQGALKAENLLLVLSNYLTEEQINTILYETITTLNGTAERVLAHRRARAA